MIIFVKLTKLSLIHISTEVGNLLATERTRVMAFSDPSLNALRVVEVSLVTYQWSYFILLHELYPTDGALVLDSAEFS